LSIYLVQIKFGSSGKREKTERRYCVNEKVRQATLADADRLVLTLVRAFDADPLINWVLRQDGKRSRAFDLYFRTTLCVIALPRGQVFVTDDCVGGALWIPSEKAEIGLALRVGCRAVFIFFEFAFVRKFSSF
jgi:hypothetical protein